MAGSIRLPPFVRAFWARFVSRVRNLLAEGFGLSVKLYFSLSYPEKAATLYFFACKMADYHHRS